MKTTTKKIILVLITLLPVLFLSACEDADWDLMEIAFESWAEENNLYEDGQWQPEGVVIKAVEKTVGSINNQKEFIELDGLDVIRDIEQADELASEAFAQNDPKKMDGAIALRPKDWRLREQNAVLAGLYGDYESSNGSMMESNRLVFEQIEINQGADCIPIRTQQLEYRETLLKEQIQVCLDMVSCDPGNLYLELDDTQQRLNNIYTLGMEVMCNPQD